MTEPERKNTIKKLTNILKEIHKPTQYYDWSKYIKDQLTNNYEKTKHYFTKEEQQLIPN